MANQEHLEIIGQGSEVWNTWRRDNNGPIPDLQEANLYKANLNVVNLRGVNLSGANLYGAHLRGANLSRADLSRADLTEADLQTGHLSRANLSGAILRGANLSGIDLNMADLTGADLRRADISGGYLKGATLRGAALDLANLSDAKLSEVDITGAMVGWTIFADNDLSFVKGLETVEHRGPSTIGIDTLFRSKGNIPEIFLRGAGLPDDFITYVRALTSRPIEFYSCFISYSSRDQNFAERLHTDLQRKGVRCWFAPEDLKIGAKTRDTIDESIRLHDKLLLILSKHSVSSQWVEHEVEAALERESRENRLVLFPVRLDDAVMDTDKAWAANIRRTRNVGDFRRWKSHDDYQKALDRMLRDLKTADAK
jgi:hypothetical protein